MDTVNDEVETCTLSTTFLKIMGCFQLGPCQLEFFDSSSLVAVGIERQLHDSESDDAILRLGRVRERISGTWVRNACRRECLQRIQRFVARSYALEVAVVWMVDLVSRETRMVQNQNLFVLVGDVSHESRAERHKVFNYLNLRELQFPALDIESLISQSECCPVLWPSHQLNFSSSWVCCDNCCFGNISW